jgi:hypothetical protein
VGRGAQGMPVGPLSTVKDPMGFPVRHGP